MPDRYPMLRMSLADGGQHGALPRQISEVVAQPASGATATVRLLVLATASVRSTTLLA